MRCRTAIDSEHPLEISDGPVEAWALLRVLPPALAQCISLLKVPLGFHCLPDDIKKVWPPLSLVFCQGAEANRESVEGMSWAFIDLFASDVWKDYLCVTGILRN